MSSTMLPAAASVVSDAYGRGSVIVDQGDTVVARFAHGIEECPKGSLRLLQTPREVLASTVWHAPLEVIARSQAASIRSVQDVWGVFSMSRIKLLPHQLWVCKQVAATWPTHWLVADDVGLGKTIEAGLILSALSSRDVVRRCLVVCPASLKEQWQFRLRTMFDIRTSVYTAEADTPKADFWNTHPFVVASLHTLRLKGENGSRRKRMLESEPWDLVVVDEAHHLNASEDEITLGYKMIEDLLDHKRVVSMVFFTGTPHRGKDYGFYSLLKLLDPVRFDPRKSATDQIPHLRSVLIRNNKQNVTDLKGRKLFQPPTVMPETYSYSPAEAAFYDMLTDFIVTGKAYAGSAQLSQPDRRLVILVLIALQKLASSSVAAIRRALRRRLEKSERSEAETRKLRDDYERARAYGTEDEVSALEEKIAALSAVVLMQDERARLAELLEAADRIREETKIGRILELVEGPFAGRSVLFFTEYKATQSLLMSALLKRFGEGCVGFINGDDRADEVVDSQGRTKSVFARREDTADRFNRGEYRFLVSTEAGGEGIDLQESCHTLIHVDLPWNPMRLHQRVGRLNRYGQTRKVEVLTIRNPSTIESDIWDKLNRKIESIMQSLGHAMDEPEDLLQLVLGMTSPSFFQELFTEGAQVPRERLSAWFDEKAHNFGGRDILDTVRSLVGNAARFDFDQVSDQLPQVDLPNLRDFFETTLELNRRRPKRNEDESIGFKTPENWANEMGVQREYDGMKFERGVSSKEINKVLGAGHRLMELALNQWINADASVAAIPRSSLPQALIVLRVSERVTGASGVVKAVIAGVEVTDDHGVGFNFLRDWEILLRLNQLTQAPGIRGKESLPVEGAPASTLSMAEEYVKAHLDRLDVAFSYPSVEVLTALWPGPAKSTL